MLSGHTVPSTKDGLARRSTKQLHALQVLREAVTTHKVSPGRVTGAMLFLEATSTEQSGECLPMCSAYASLPVWLQLLCYGRSGVRSWLMFAADVLDKMQGKWRLVS